MKLRFRESVILLAVGLLPAAVASANTVTAQSCSSSDVSSAINSAANGDTVVIPNGSCTWTTGINTSKQIILSGQTKGGVMITDSAGSASMLAFTTGSSFSTEVRNLTFLDGSASGGFYLDVGGSGKLPLIHDNYFRLPDFKLEFAVRIGRNGAVIYNNTFESLNANGSGSGNIQISAMGASNSWTTASTMGMADTTGTANVYIEDNVFNNIYLSAIDCDNNARTVIRYNTFNDSGFVCHGADTSPIGQRHTEVYNNTFVFHTSGSSGGITYPLNLNWWWYIRGGTGVFTDNVVPNISSVMWGTKPKVDLTIQNLRRNSGPNPCCTSYPCPHQIGQSHNGSSQVLEPFYFWNNTGTGGSTLPSLSDYSPNECSANAPSTSSFVVSGRDYISGAAKPGYVKYTYPHPLRTGGTTTPVPAAPSNVRVIR
jgi:hypothetical protein